MSPSLRVMWAVARKDLLLEVRTRERIVVMAAFAVLVAVLAHFASDPTAPTVRETAAGFLWLAILLSGLVGIGRTFHLEEVDGGLDGILASPAPLAAVYFGKAAANAVMVAAVAVLASGTFALFFGLDIGPEWGWLAATLGLGVIAFTALATLFASISAQSRLGESLLPVLLFPLLVPILVYGVGATNRILRPGAFEGFSDIEGNLRMLAAAALLALTLGAVLFRHTVED